MAANEGKQHEVRQGGFTLIEILVVLIIIGVVLTFATLSVNPSSSSDRLDTESQRLLALSQAAADDAILYGQTIGIQLTRHGYQFLVLGPAGWKTINDPDSPLRPRRLDDDIHIDRVQVTDEDRRDGSDNSTSSDDIALPASVVAPDSSSDSSGSDDDKDETVPRPDALFLSSGELLPFNLEVSADGVDHRFDVVGSPNGDIRIRRVSR